MNTGSSEIDNNPAESTWGRWRRRLLWGMAAALLLIVTAAILIWLWWRQSSPEQRLETLLSQQLGAAVTVRQPLEIDLWPRLDITARDLSVAHPDAADDRALIQLDTVTLDIPWKDLIVGEYAGADIQAGALEVVLDTDDQGLPDLSPLSRLGPGNDDGGGPFSLPALSLDSLVLHTRDRSWLMRLRPLTIQSGQAVQTELLLQSPEFTVAGDLVLNRTDNRIRIGSSELDIQMPFWPKQASMTLESRVNLDDSSVAFSEFSLVGADSFRLSATGQAGWRPGLSGEMDLTLTLLNSLEPLGGQGPELQLSGRLNIQGPQAGFTATGSLGSSELSLESGVCLNQPSRLGVEASLQRLELSAWVLPGDWPSADEEGAQGTVLAANLEVAEFLDGDLRAEDVVVRWQSHDVSAPSILLECSP